MNATPERVSSIIVNSYARILGKPCKVTAIESVDSHSKGITGVDVYTGKEYREVFRQEDTIDTFFLFKENLSVAWTLSLLVIGTQALSIADGYVMCMDENGESRDMKLPEGELGERIENDIAANKSVTVTVHRAMGESVIVAAFTEE